MASNKQLRLSIGQDPLFLAMSEVFCALGHLAHDSDLPDLCQKATKAYDEYCVKFLLKSKSKSNASQGLAVLRNSMFKQFLAPVVHPGPSGRAFLFLTEQAKGLAPPHSHFLHLCLLIRSRFKTLALNRGLDTENLPDVLDQMDQEDNLLFLAAVDVLFALILPPAEKVFPKTKVGHKLCLLDQAEPVFNGGSKAALRISLVTGLASYSSRDFPWSVQGEYKKLRELTRKQDLTPQDETLLKRYQSLKREMIPLKSESCTGSPEVSQVPEFPALETTGSLSGSPPPVQYVQMTPPNSPPVQSPPAQSPPAQNPPAQSPPVQSPPPQSPPVQNPSPERLSLPGSPDTTDSLFNLMSQLETFVDGVLALPPGQ